MNVSAGSRSDGGLPSAPTIVLPAGGSARNLLELPGNEALLNAIGQQIVGRRWFGGKTREICRVELIEVATISRNAWLALARCEFRDGPDEVYQLPLAVVPSQDAPRTATAKRIWAELQTDEGESSVLIDPLEDETFCQSLLGSFSKHSRWQGTHGEIVANQTAAFDSLRGEPSQVLAARMVQAEQSNSSIAFGDRLMLKLIRRVETGLNPDLEITAYLTDHGFEHVPRLAGSLEYLRVGREPWALGILQAYVANRGDGWRTMLAQITDALQSALATDAFDIPPPVGDLFAAAQSPPPTGVAKALRGFIRDAELLAERTAELHLTLAAEEHDPAFTPEPFTVADRQTFCEHTVAMVRETWQLLRGKSLSGEARRLQSNVEQRDRLLITWFERFCDADIEVHKIRCHGDYHLGQILATDDDFVIIDFEGEPARPLAERREKQLALRDIAGMVRSFHYASCAAAVAMKETTRSEQHERIDRWAASWYAWTSSAFLRQYQATTRGARFLPQSAAQFQQLLQACLLQKAIYELRYELNNRPDWVHLPLTALAELTTSLAVDEPI